MTYFDLIKTLVQTSDAYDAAIDAAHVERDFDDATKPSPHDINACRWWLAGIAYAAAQAPTKTQRLCVVFADGSIWTDRDDERTRAAYRSGALNFAEKTPARLVTVEFSEGPCTP